MLITSDVMSSVDEKSTADSARERFDNEAAAWDSNPTTVLSSELAYQALTRKVPELRGKQDPKPHLLEIGCGTGLLSYLLLPHIATLLGVDVSAGMIAAFEAKLSIDKSRSSKLAAVCTYLESADDAKVQDAARNLSRGSSSDGLYKFDVVISHLVLHHIPDLRNIFTVMFDILRPGGCVALTDFEDTGPEAVLFHPSTKREGVERHGIKRNEMTQLLVEVGFTNVEVDVCFELRKEVEVEEERAEERSFPFLLCMGRKP
ncbi:S-adenosyl-L-methionine-dependent methyltransferase [Patellaria atrata CBS 101060]|uniref:S-adenosyl-L-methionine-dependent methyltransferase n=1 Tax=Patellaria atrata CBS 101060 TaxID=1346257 RepID=A0A9P4SIA4_9PEZI|nr:S-adenosyl-L-methionine-dependent methyltransferase [Patellaria atrata CBS 101060]